MTIKSITDQEIQQMVIDLKEIAVENPFCPDDMLKGIVSLKGPHERHRREFSYQDIPIRLNFTLTVLGVRKFYHLSMGDMGGMNRKRKVLPENVEHQLLKAFFQDEYMEMPSMLHGDSVRHFIQVKN